MSVCCVSVSREIVWQTRVSLFCFVLFWVLEVRNHIFFVFSALQFDKEKRFGWFLFRNTWFWMGWQDFYGFCQETEIRNTAKPALSFPLTC